MNSNSTSRDNTNENKQKSISNSISYYSRSSSNSSSGSLVFVGVLIAVGGQFLIASGAVLQKYTHEQIRKRIQQERRMSDNGVETAVHNSTGLSVQVGNQNMELKEPLDKNNSTLEKTTVEDMQENIYHTAHSSLDLDSSPPLTNVKLVKNTRSDHIKEQTCRAHSFDDWDKMKRREQLLDTGDTADSTEYQELSLDIAALSRLNGFTADRLFDGYVDSNDLEEGNHVSEYRPEEKQNQKEAVDIISRFRKVRKRLIEKSSSINRPRNISITSEPVRKKTLFNISPPQSPHVNWEDVATRHGLHIPNSESFRQVERIIEEQHRQDTGAIERTHYLKMKKWWTGLLLIGGGEACNLIAFGFAPGSTIAPLGVLVVPINALLAWKFLKEKVTWVTIFGILLSIAGAALVGVFGPSGPDSTGALNQSQILHLLDNVAFIVFISITVGVICAIFVINMITGIGVRYLLVYALMSGMSAAVSVTSAKGVVQLIRYSVTGHGDQLAKPLIYVMAFVLLVTIVFMVYYMNRGMQTFRVTLFLAVYYGFFMTFSVVSSILMDRTYLYRKRLNLWKQQEN
ncbi:Magnesium transporter NIPA4 [Galdieria sulphuraria]|nr:Magnesium transporter NIPA4 [Galdieria sulphuraria]